MKASKSSMFVLGGMAIVILCFFLPWVSVSFFGVSIAASGMQLASGSGSSIGDLGGEFKASPLLYIVPLLAIAAALVAYLGVKKIGAKNSGIVTMILGAIPLAYGAYKLMQLNSQLKESLAAVESYGLKMNLMSMLGVGFWGTAIGFVLVVVGGAMMMREKDNVAPANTSESV